MYLDIKDMHVTIFMNLIGILLKDLVKYVNVTAIYEFS